MIFKKLYILLFLFSSCLTVLGQYSEYKQINPYPRTIAEKILIDSILFDQKREYTGVHQCEILQNGETLKIASNGGDPYITMPKLKTPISGDIEMTFRVRATTDSPAEIFTMTEKKPYADAERSFRFSFANDWNWHESSLVFNAAEPMTQFRLDPGTSVGEFEIEWIQLKQVKYAPIEIKCFSVDENGYEVETIDNRNGKTETKSGIFPKKRPFESIVVKNGGEEWLATAFHESIETEWLAIGNENLKCLFAKDGSGAKILADGKIVGVICPLAYSDPNLLPSKNMPFGVHPLTLFSHSGDSIAFDLKNAQRLAFSVVGNEIRIERDSDEMFGPVFRPFGNMKQAVLSGVEYLEEGEHSSSTADIETSEHVRFAPDPLCLTMPFIGFVTDKCSFGVLWGNLDETRPIFATPDFLDGRKKGDKLEHRISLYGKKIEGSVRVMPSEEPLENVILWAVKKHGLPDLPPIPRSLEEQRKLNLAAFENSVIRTENGWMHAALQNSAGPFKPLYGSDFVSTIWQLTGKLPDVPRLDCGGGHIPNYLSFLLLNNADMLLSWLNGTAENIRKSQQADGSFRYTGQFLKGHWDDTASGHCGNNVYRLLEHWRITGNQDSLQAALKGLEFIKHFKTPRGAQTWELSLHTPDIMASSRCVLANVLAFEATGKQEYINEARRWAITGLPFVYFWRAVCCANEKDAVMAYATTPVFGATHWRAPNWIGLPVNWCGLDYAYSLLLLAPHDGTLNWRQIAEGILICSEQMQYTEGPSIGLLPDSWNLRAQSPNPFDINPCTLEMLRRMLLGEPGNVYVFVGESRIVSPYRVKSVANGRITFDCENAPTFQILLNGKPESVTNGVIFNRP